MNCPEEITNLSLVETQAYTVCGYSCQTNFTNMPQQTFALWQQLQTQLKAQPINLPQLVSLQKYPDGFFEKFDVNTPFEKFAAMIQPPEKIELANTNSWPINGGTCVKFTYTGPMQKFGLAIQYMLQHWLPANQLVVDYNRHFAEWLHPSYSMQQPINQEDVFIPVIRIV